MGQERLRVGTVDIWGKASAHKFQYGWAVGVYHRFISQPDLKNLKNAFFPSGVNYVWRIHSDVFGFWYDEHAMEYNIVVLEFDSGDTINVIEYSFNAYPKKKYSNAKVVRRSNFHENIPYKKFDHDSFGIFHDGCLNWLASNAIDVSKKIILVYGCWTKELYELPLPANKNCDSLMCLTIFGENLCVVFFSGTVLDVWEMHEYGVMESWVMLHTFLRQDIV
ncbi:hypothetical protein IFM89_000329 [Coptis chinensis]|uniref:F-box protein n=1 Tax=Coptis chinensis TaxID=261450 RepID=A0A835H8T7_9MAGN|nr:hypothetical protein IFM89_000329 [Coptis chinensis]